MALLSGGPRTATVTAETDVQLMVLAPREFEVILDREPAVARAILRGMAHRVRSLQPAHTH